MSLTRIIELVDSNLIYCLIPIILSLLLFRLIFKSQQETTKALNIIRWFILVYSLCTLLLQLLDLSLNPESQSYFSRTATGPYALAYWTMFVGAFILPLTLFSEKLASKPWYLLLVAFALKLGFYIERFVIISSNFHRSATEGELFITSTLNGILLICLQGVIIAILMILYIKGKQRLRQNKKTKYIDKNPNI